MRRSRNSQDPDYGDYMRDQQKDDKLTQEWALKKACPDCPAQPGENCKFKEEDFEHLGFHHRRVP